MLRGIFGLLEAEGTRGRNNGQTIVIKNEGEHHKKKRIKWFRRDRSKFPSMLCELNDCEDGRCGVFWNDMWVC